jgi:hypothetical protein
MASPAWTGPAPDEFADFEAASRPRRRRLSAGAWLRLAGQVIFFVLLAAAVVHFLRWTRDNSPERLVVGEWQTGEHPYLSALGVSQHGPVRGETRDGIPASGKFAFRSRGTVVIEWHDPTLYGKKNHFRLEFHGREMITHDLDSGLSYRWLRRN